MKNSDINISIESMEDIFDKYCDEKIVDNLEHYIYKNSIINFKDKKIEHNIVFTCKFKITDEQKNKLVDALRYSFGNLVKEEIIYSKLHNFRMFFLLLIGIAMIAVAHYLLADIAIISEVLLIAGWVCIWELVYGILFTDLKRKIRKTRCKTISECKIKFIS